MYSDITPLDITTPKSVIKRKRGDVLDFLSKESETDAHMMGKLLEIKGIVFLFRKTAENKRRTFTWNVN